MHNKVVRLRRVDKNMGLGGFLVVNCWLELEVASEMFGKHDRIGVCLEKVGLKKKIKIKIKTITKITANWASCRMGFERH